MLNRLLPVLFVPAIACGGGDTPTPTPIDTPPVTPDSPTVLACPPAGPLQGAVGTAQAPVGVPPGACGADGMTPCDWYSAPTMGSNTGVTEFLFIIGIQDTMDQLQFHVATPIVLNQAIPFLTDANSMAQYQALSIYLQSQNGSTVDRVLFPTAGTATLSESNQAMGGKTTAVISNVNYAELDDNGAVLAGGCTVALSTLNLFLAQGSATFAKPEGDSADPSGRPWMKIIPNGQLGRLY